LANDNKLHARHFKRSDTSCKARHHRQGKRTTVLDISRTAQQEAIADTELTAADAQRLHLMEAMLRDRGYSRNQHGF
jgi:hypothetical protein